MGEPLRPQAHGVTPSRRATALHEAAHAVAHYFHPLAGRTRSVTITPSGDTLGLHRSGRTLPIVRGGIVVDREALAHELVALLAGGAAEWIAAGADPLARTPRARARARKLAAAADGTDDYSRALTLCYAASPPDVRAAVALVPEAERAGMTEAAMRERIAPALDAHHAAVLERLEAARREAHDFVASHWPHVTAVADRLLVAQTLTGDEVREIIEAVEERLRSGPPRFDFGEVTR